MGWWTVYHDFVNRDSEWFCYQNTSYLFDFKNLLLLFMCPLLFVSAVFALSKLFQVSGELSGIAR